MCRFMAVVLCSCSCNGFKHWIFFPFAFSLLRSPGPPFICYIDPQNEFFECTHWLSVRKPESVFGWSRPFSLRPRRWDWIWTWIFAGKLFPPEQAGVDPKTEVFWSSLCTTVLWQQKAIWQVHQTSYQSPSSGYTCGLFQILEATEPLHNAGCRLGKIH